jgi:hypothetical protein
MEDYIFNKVFDFDGKNYKITVGKYLEDSYVVDFARRGDIDPFEFGESYWERKIYNDTPRPVTLIRKTLNILIDFLNENKISNFIYHAEEKNRQRFYNYIAKIIEKKTNYKISVYFFLQHDI